MEVTDSEKHSSLLRYGINYSCKKFYITVSWTSSYRHQFVCFNKCAGPNQGPIL